PAARRGVLAGVWTRSAKERERLARIRGSNSARARRPRSQRGPQVEVAAVAFFLLGGTLLAGAAGGRLSEAAGFFGAGISILVSLLCLQSILLHRTPSSALKAAGTSPLWAYGVRQAC